jgi:hypothetical protein
MPPIDGSLPKSRRQWQVGAACLAALGAIALGFVAPAAGKTLHIVLASPLVEEGSDPDGCGPAVSGLGGPAAWQVRIERQLLDGKALVESSQQAVQDRFPLCIADRPVAKNAEVELSFVAHAGGIARSAGIVLRFSDPKDFYVLEADGLAGRLRLLRVRDGERHEIAGSVVSLGDTEAHTITVKAVDETFKVRLDGDVVFTARDAGILTAGRFGISSRADSRTSFGDLFITLLD